MQNTTAQKSTAPHTSARLRATVRVPMHLNSGASVTAELHTFAGLSDPGEHIALTLGERNRTSEQVPLVRLHSECLTGDVLGSARCDCGPQLQEATRQIDAEGGCLLYLRQEGRGIGLYNKLDAYVLQDRGFDTYAANEELNLDPDARNYRVAAEMLTLLGFTSIRLLTNNPEKAKQLAQYGIDVVAVVPTGVFVTEDNRYYLETKARVTRHTLALSGI
ncbi:GTP cyclohydrolase II [Streptacidiphilus melanogenes]|uniref:GTP cyclohydrolase II n=1 Tax=Streptacidiphilus melanogenes TaxID=411235 RepID=UPI0005A70B6D|nr:GTP cyclohydrolase II [Streptacidiphilus melanogenes]